MWKILFQINFNRKITTKDKTSQTTLNLCSSFEGHAYDRIEEVHLQSVDSLNIQFGRSSPFIVENLLLFSFIIQVFAGNHLEMTGEICEVGQNSEPEKK